MTRLAVARSRPQRRPTPSGPRGAASDGVRRALRTRGDPIPAAHRRTLEARLGHDFASVRVHRDAEAARALGARAFTSGPHVVFGSGEYAPETSRGTRLLAHELAHVIQQGAAAPLGGGPAPRADGSAAQVQREALPAGDDRRVVKKVKTNHGGLETKLPLTPDVLSWIENPESKPVSPKDPSHFPERRHEGQAFVWGEADERPVHASDVNQGYLGDCYFMALLAAIAAVRPGLIEQMVRSNDDGTFTVSFFGPDGTRVHQIVEPTFPSYKSLKTPSYASFGDESATFGNELWPMLIEKAWAQEKGGWLKIEGSKVGLQEHARAMTGHEADAVKLPGGLTSEELLVRLTEHFVTRRQPATFFTYKTTAASKKKEKKTGVITNHGYALEDMHPKEKTADLYNPHGPEADHLRGKTMPFLRGNFRRVVFFDLGTGGKPKTSHAPPTAEETVAHEAVPEDILADSGVDATVDLFEKELVSTRSILEARVVVERYAEKLWLDAKSVAQADKGAVTDDRPLYWARLQMAALLRGFAPAAYRMSPMEKELLLEILEAGSRGMAEIDFPEEREEGDRHVLVSGFDPFGFQSGGSRRQANPSGAAVLALDGTPVSAEGDVTGRVEGVIFPVRFRDFDRGIVERTFRPYLKGPKAVDMIMTISQGDTRLDPKASKKKQSEAFELEQFAGRRRSTRAPGNVGDVPGVDVPEEGRRMAPTARPEFLESSLPWEDVHKGMKRGQTTGESELWYLPEGESSPEHMEQGDLGAEELKGAKAVEGSGGGYLSNEVAYRTALLRKERGSSVPVGHLHVPILDAMLSERKHARMRDRIIKWVKRIIALALPALGKKQKK